MNRPNLAIAERRRGAVAVEMALITPIFLMLAFGIIEFGRGMMVSNMVVNAAREGARMAVLDGSTNANVTTSIKSFLNSALGIAATNVTVTITTTPGTGNPDPINVIANCQPGDLINVNVQVPFNSVALIPGTYLTGKILSGQSAMRHE